MTMTVRDPVDHGAYLVAHLTSRAEEAERSGRGADVLRFVLAHGRLYDRLAPRQPAMMTPNACFENAAVTTMHSDLTYVEGFALVAVPGLVGFDHAWCADSADNIYEMTWREPGLAYFGIAFATDYLIRRLASARHHEHGLLRTDDGSLFSGRAQGWRP